MTMVSIIVPTYNYEKYICDAVDSILNQTFKDFEIIVVDDGSTDDTYKVLEKYDDRIVYLYQENSGPASARNLGIKKSKGKYICFLDADDMFLPNKLEKQVALMEKERKIGLIYSNYLCIDERNSRILKHYRCKKFSDHRVAFNNLLTYNYINTSTVMIRKACIGKVGLFNEKYSYLEDYDLWVRIGKDYGIDCIHNPLVKTRSHKNNLRNRISKSDKIRCYKEISKKNKGEG